LRDLRGPGKGREGKEMGKGGIVEGGGVGIA